MDFYRIREHAAKNGVVEIYPEFLVARSHDLMIQAKTFVGIWDEAAGLWSTDEYDVARLVDAELDAYFEENRQRYGQNAYVKHMQDYSSGTWVNYRNWISKLSDNAHTLDQSLTFADTPVRREDYASRRLPYSLEDTFPENWDKLVGKLYAPDERAKLEWAIGSIVSGDSKRIQKFLVLYGEKGTGKSTILDIVQMLFKGYYTVFEAKALGQANAQFATESFKNSPLVAIQHDGDLSRIEDNTRLNSIISHEEMVINEKNKPLYNAAVNAFLFMGTNHPVKITDAKSGIIRRLIDATPTGNKFSPSEYETLMTQIKAELGPIAQYCLNKYYSMGKNYYRDYIPMSMMMKTDVFYNFIEDSALDLIENDPISLKRAWDMYKAYCDETRLEFTMPMYKFREALKDYYDSFEPRYHKGDISLRNAYIGFKKDKLNQGKMEAEPEKPYSITMDQQVSLLDEILMDCPAQYSSDKGTPQKAWDNVTTTLAELDTSREHYVRPPSSLICIDFDLKDDDGNKSAQRNLEAASKLPPTYAEFSKGGAGVHLHYWYDGAVEELSAVYSEGIEVKVFAGKSSLRRRVSFCNNIPVAHISEGLPLKEKKPMINPNYVTTEKSLREQVEKNLRKEVHGATKPSMDFIKKILNDAYDAGVDYDLSEMRPKVLAFAMGSTNQAQNCLKVYSEIQFKGKSVDPEIIETTDIGFPTGDLVFYDIEVYPNLFLVCWKKDGGSSVVKMVNPKPQDLEAFVEMPLVGFNNRRYDNHLIYARWMGASIEECYRISQRIINGDRDAQFAQAYNLSYTDIYDFSSKKQSLKKWEIEMGITHMEMEIPWDEPVPDEKMDSVIKYCSNDVEATEKLFHYLEDDFKAREILADVAGLTPNATTNTLTQTIIFGKDRNPPFVHEDLATEFPGYKYSFGKSTYRGEEVNEGGYVYAEPGIYHNVALLDIASMHPHSLIALEAFGPTYTQKFKDIVDSRIAVKHGDKEALKTLLDGKLLPYYSDDKESRTKLAYALKIAINSVYGLTAAKFPTRCNGMDPSNNQDNIVAKRGSLFMVDLKHMVQEEGFTVAHIKTDSIKIPDATPEIIQKVMDFGNKYGYNFEHEATYDRICLVNNAVYIAHDDEGWHATGAEFQHPIVYKTLFSHEEINLDDYFETKSVTTSLYIQYGEDNREFVGRVGSFAPVIPQDGVINAGELVREKDGKYYAATGSKGHLWQLSSRVTNKDQIDKSYSQTLVDEAKRHIETYGDFEAFVAL